MSIIKVLGKMERGYVDKTTGEHRNFRRIYAEYVDGSEEEGLTGNRVEEIKPPMGFDMAKILIGQHYELLIERRGQYANIADIRPCKV